ncbi:GyrI-like domain-containing protein [Chitinophagaceae bacterium MMS25-I14]
MNTTSVAPFYIVGLAIRTTNENGQAATDIPQLWNKFLSENIMGHISNKTDDAIYCIYTDYELDYTKPYTTLLGCKVSGIDDLPEGLTGRAFTGGEYTLFTAKGRLADGIVYKEWINIWNTDLPRAYTADFEIYGAAAQNPDEATVDIFIAVQ